MWSPRGPRHRLTAAAEAQICHSAFNNTQASLLASCSHWCPNPKPVWRPPLLLWKCWPLTFGKAVLVPNIMDIQARKMVRRELREFFRAPFLHLLILLFLLMLLHLCFLLLLLLFVLLFLHQLAFPSPSPPPPLAPPAPSAARPALLPYPLHPPPPACCGDPTGLHHFSSIFWPQNSSLLPWCLVMN